MNMYSDIFEFIMSFLIFERKENQEPDLEPPQEEEEEHWIFTSYV